MVETLLLLFGFPIFLGAILGTLQGGKLFRVVPLALIVWLGALIAVIVWDQIANRQSGAAPSHLLAIVLFVWVPVSVVVWGISYLIVKRGAE